MSLKEYVPPRLKPSLRLGRDRLVEAVELAPDYARSLYLGAAQRHMFDDVERYVMFVGYPRSGHTLIGSLLNAHPEVVVANELNALRHVGVGFSRRQLYALLLEKDREFGGLGRFSGAYDYRVEGQWQGRVERLRVIGDKKGGGSSLLLGRRPELLDRLRSTVGVPLRLVHVARNPFDNIATLNRRSLGYTLEESVNLYFRLANTVEWSATRVRADEWLELHHAEFVADPAGAMRQLAAFVGVGATDTYIDACARIVRPTPSRTRDGAAWTPHLIDEVRRRSDGYHFLRGYVDEVPALA